MREEPAKYGTGALALLLLSGLAWSMPAMAQSVQKCIGHGGHVTFTSGDCGEGERLAASYAAVPDTIVPAAAYPDAGAGQARPEHRRQGPSRAGTGVRKRAPPDRCKAARDRREQTLRRVGLKRNFDLLRKLDDQVWDACR